MEANLTRGNSITEQEQWYPWMLVALEKENNKIVAELQFSENLSRKSKQMNRFTKSLIFNKRKGKI